MLLRFSFFVFCFSFFWFVCITTLTTDWIQSFFILLFTLLLSLNMYFLLGKKSGVFFLPLLMGAILWIFCTSFHLWQLQSKQELLAPYFLYKKVKIEAKMVDVYKKEDQSTTYLFDLQKLENSRFSKMSFLWKIPSNLEVNVWEMITFETPIYQLNWSQSYSMNMQVKNVFFKVYPFTFLSTGKQDTFFVLLWLSDFRTALLTRIGELFPEEEGVFLGWILLWASENLDPTLSRHFNLTGLTHLIAVSGSNVTILILFLGAICKYLPYMVSFPIIVLWVVGFLFLVWVSPPVLSAVCMGIISYLALMNASKVDSIVLFFFVLMLFILYSPLSLCYDISLQLSFLAVLGILLFHSFFEKMLFFLPRFLAISESVVMTFCALITTIPIMMTNFGYISLVSPISNLMVAWTIGPMMFFWAFAIIWSYIVTLFGYFFSFIAYIFLRFDITTVHFLWSLDWNTFEVSLWAYGSVFVLLYYMVLTFFYFFFKKMNPQDEDSLKIK